MTTEIDRFLRLKHVEEMVGLASSTIYRRMGEGDFPRPVDVGGGAVRWVESEVREWQQQRLSNRV